jgi:signal transduction histidine kinase
MQALTLLAASVAHEIGNPLNALDIHLQLMERELRKLREGGLNGTRPSEEKARRRRKVEPTVESCADAIERLDRYVSVAKGEIVRLDYIVRQFLKPSGRRRRSWRPPT